MKKFTSLEGVRAFLSQGHTMVDVVKYYLQRIQEQKHLNAIVESFDDEALQLAEVIQAKWEAGTAGKLAGMVICLKDNICYQGHSVTASSRILEGFISLYSSTVVERLLAEDAIIIGRCNCDEFAMGASNETSVYGPVKNAYDELRVSGGSSGGCAVAVQADMCLAAFGSDTGGSIRQPAAFTGQYGYKPAYGRISRWGLLAYGSSFDQIGPIATSLDDMALLMDVVSGPDEHDATAIPEPPNPLLPAVNQSPKNLRFGYIKECFESPGLDMEIKALMTAQFERLRQEGHDIEEVSFPLLDALVPAYYVLTTAEASSNLSRYSGLLFGHRTAEKGSLDTLFKKSRSEGFGAEVQRRIMLGTFVLSAGYYDAYYSKAQQVRRLIMEHTESLLAQCDFLISPTTPTVAFRFGEKTADPVAMYLADIFTVQANLSGHPAISIPASGHSSGMPYGIQLLGKKENEPALFSAATLFS